MFLSDTDRSLRSPSFPFYAPDILFFQSDSEKVEKESVSTQISASSESSGCIRFNLSIPGARVKCNLGILLIGSEQICHFVSATYAGNRA